MDHESSRSVRTNRTVCQPGALYREPVSLSVGGTRRTLQGNRTAFERNLLPDFAAWTIDQIERCQPDLLIPAETKGARVLDTALAYARDELGVAVSTPIVYGSALSYLPADLLREARVMIVDDAVRTGTNMRRHWGHIAGHQVSEIEAIACIGYGRSDDVRPDVHCYLSVEEEQYERYVWQLTELVVARGLPPEVDHYLYELNLPGRFGGAWPEVIEMLAPWGVVTVDAPRSHVDTPQPVTLHFPEFPSLSSSPQPEGANKLRLFPDVDGGRVFAIPIAFPALTLPGIESEEIIGGELARSAVVEEIGHLPAIASLLINEAVDLDAKTLFRIISASRELEMIAGLAGVLEAGFGDFQLSARDETIDRLYGANVGAAVSRVVSDRVREARSAPIEQPPELCVTPPGEPFYLEASIAEQTRELAVDLKGLYDARAEEDDHDPAERVGRSMSELARDVSGENPLTASRCVDFGLALTTLVPYVEETETEAGDLRIERCYRVSETNRGQERPYASLDDIRQRKSEEALAVICRRIQETWPGFSEQPVPLELLTAVVAILRPLTLAEESIDLKVLPAPGSRFELVLIDTVLPLLVDGTNSVFYVQDEHGLSPSETFSTRYSAEDLNIDLDGVTESIEANVDKLAVLIGSIEEADQRQKILDSWAMSVDDRLGLTHVRRSTQEAIECMRRTLILVSRGHPHEASPGIGEQVGAAFEAVSEKLDLLESDWAQTAAFFWESGSGRGEQRIIGSLGAPERQTIYAIPRALAALLAPLAELVKRLDAVSARRWRSESHSSDHEVCQAVVATVAGIRRSMTTFEEDTGEAIQLPAELDQAILLGADSLSTLLDQLDAFMAALAGTSCGPRRRRQVPAAQGGSRHVTVLSVDLQDSTTHAIVGSSFPRWANNGLNLASQWTRAFGGFELADRRGDDLTVEFINPDSATLAAAAVLVYSDALRSTKRPGLDWGYHVGLECGEVDDADGGNTLGGCVNIAAKLAKGDGGDADRVFLGEECARNCSAPLNEALVVTGPDVEIAKVEDQSITVHSRVVDAARAIELVVGRVQAVARTATEGLPEMPDIDAPVQAGPAPEADQAQQAQNLG